MSFFPFELEPSWLEALKPESEKGYLAPLAAYLAEEQKNQTIYPPADLIFNALWQTPLKDVKAVIVGQDPYHGPNQAHGLSFSVPNGVPIPPSLQNIYKEIKADLGIQGFSHGCLLSWAKQGVLLLNALLTVRKGEPLSHQGRGWEKWTDAILAAIANRNQPCVFLLWGKSAQQKVQFLQNHPHCHLLKAPHPSPLSAHQGFMGCRHFSLANEYLISKGITPIDWNL